MKKFPELEGAHGLQQLGVSLPLTIVQANASRVVSLVSK